MMDGYEAAFQCRDKGCQAWHVKDNERRAAYWDNGLRWTENQCLVPLDRLKANAWASEPAQTTRGPRPSPEAWGCMECDAWHGPGGDNRGLHGNPLGDLAPHLKGD